MQRSRWQNPGRVRERGHVHTQLERFHASRYLATSRIYILAHSLSSAKCQGHVAAPLRTCASLEYMRKEARVHAEGTSKTQQHQMVESFSL